MDFKNMTCLIIDSGISCEIAARLSLDFGKTYYCTPSFSGFPEHKKFAPGLGLGNIIKMDDRKNPIKFWDKVEEADLIVTPDVGFGDIATFIRKMLPNKRVFGAGGADILEEDRLFLKEVQAKVGLPVQDYETAVGMEELRKKLKLLKDVVIKPHSFRGDRETFPMKRYEDVEEILEQMDVSYGIGKYYQPFVIEKMMEFIAEIGCDLFYNGRNYISPYLWGIENGAPYLGKYDKKLPDSLMRTMEAFKPIFDGYGYKGAISTEELVVGKDESFLLDLTPRMPQPMSSMYTETIKNFSEVIYAVAGGEDIDIKPAGRYIGCLPIQSDAALDKWIRIIYKDKFEKNIKLVYGCRWEKKTFCIKGFATAVNVVAFGDSAKQVVSQLEQLIEEVNFDDAEKEKSSLYEILENFEALEDAGIHF